MLINPKPDSQESSVDMAPLIDMVFLLLIFFLVATTFHQTEREMKIALPDAQTGGPITASLREIIINVDDEGTIYVSGRVVSVEDLRGMVEEAIAQNPDQKVTVRGDRNTVYANIVGVLDVCKGAGIQEPYLDTVIADM